LVFSECITVTVVGQGYDQRCAVAAPEKIRDTFPIAKGMV
jgi:hypothetical protein